ncbi:MAG TPA: two-component regulator propeller domain-containing protein, partial [Chitinophagaceae bacterium]|nr:two-component regulator propeller domain-containing protein [Chitinophagaceae bacterium]
MVRRLAILTLITSHLHGLAQEIDEKNFQHYTTREGLSNNHISGIYQDAFGYIWLGTYRGLNRFDGVTFTQFVHSGDANSLPDNTIFSMQQLPSDGIAVSTNDGAQIISTKTLSKINLEISTTDPLRYWSNAVRYTAIDGSGNYCVSTKTGFYIFSPDGNLRRRYDQYTEQHIGKVWMTFGRHLYTLPDGNIMQENSRGLLFYDRARNVIGDVKDHYPTLVSFQAHIQATRDRFNFISRNTILLANSVTNEFELIDVRTGGSKRFPACFNLQQENGWRTNLTHLRDDIWVVNSVGKGFFLLKIDTLTNTISCFSK